MHELTPLVVRTKRGITSNIATFHHEIRATAGFILQRFCGGSQQHKRFSMPRQPAFWETSMLAQPAQCT